MPGVAGGVGVDPGGPGLWDPSAEVTVSIRVLEARSNLALAYQRNEAARLVNAAFGQRERGLADRLLRDANHELLDALRVLTHSRLHPRVRSKIRDAIAAQRFARDSESPETRAFFCVLAAALTRRASQALADDNPIF